MNRFPSLPSKQGKADGATEMFGAIIHRPLLLEDGILYIEGRALGPQEPNRENLGKRSYDFSKQRF